MSEAATESPKKRVREDDKNAEPKAKQAKVESEVKESAVKEAKSDESKEEVAEVTGKTEDKEDKVEAKEETKEDKVEKKESKDTKATADSNPTPKFVFGSTTPFGKVGGFGGFRPGKSIFDNNKDSKQSTRIFGSGSSFGNAFQDAIKKKSIFDEPPKETEKVEKVSKPAAAAFEKQNVKSGEENETTLFQVKAKLYRLDLSKVSDGWRERGVGVLKVNRLSKPTATYSSRLIMRQSGSLKLILNLPLVAGLPVFRGMASSFADQKFIRIQTLEEGKPIQYAFKIGQVENVSSAYDNITAQIPKGGAK